MFKDIFFEIHLRQEMLLSKLYWKIKVLPEYTDVLIMSIMLRF